MIFATVGSVVPWDELAQELDRLAPILGEDIAMQIGGGKYEPKNIRWFRFKVGLNDWYQHADTIIVLIGASTFEALLSGKKVIAMANPHTNQPQNDDIARKLEEDGCLLYCRGIYELEPLLRNIGRWLPQRYVQPECRMGEHIKGFLMPK